MNKAAGVGIAIIIIVAIAGVAYSLSSTKSIDENLPAVDDLNLNESVLLDEGIVSEEFEQVGKELSVELTESIGIKSP